MSLLASAICVPVVLTGCKTAETAFDNDCKVGGAAIGAVVGGVAAGLLLGKASGKIGTALLGAAVGGLIGQQIGSLLDCQDRQAVDAKTAEAVTNAKDGEKVTWSNPQTGASAVITPQETKTEQRTVALVREKRVAPLPKLELIGETWEAKKAANVRTAPTTDAEIVSGLKTGETFTAVGKVDGSDWIVVGRGKRTIGYVSASLVQKASPTAVAAAAPAASVRPAVNLDAVEKDRAVDLDAANTVTQEVATASTCRTMDVKVTAKDGQSGQQNVKACKGTDGAWEIL